MDTYRNLPVEILETIFNTLYDNGDVSTLAICSSSSTVLYSLCQKLIFRDIGLHRRWVWRVSSRAHSGAHDRFSSVNPNFIETFENSPHIAGYVHHLTIILFIPDKERVVESDRRMGDDSQLIPFLSRLTSLRTVAVRAFSYSDHAYWPIPYRKLPSSVQKLLLMVFSSPRLIEIDVTKVISFPTSILQNGSSLKRLLIRWIDAESLVDWARSADSDSQTSVPSPPLNQLDYLHISNFGDLNSNELDNIANWLHSLPLLKHLSLRFSMFFRESYLPKFDVNGLTGLISISIKAAIWFNSFPINGIAIEFINSHVPLIGDFLSSISSSSPSAKTLSKITLLLLLSEGHAEHQHLLIGAFDSVQWISPDRFKNLRNFELQLRGDGITAVDLIKNDKTLACLVSKEYFSLVIDSTNEFPSREDY